MINVIMRAKRQRQRCQLFPLIFRYAFMSYSVVKRTTNIYKHMKLDAKFIGASWHLCMIKIKGIPEESSRIEIYYAAGF